MREVLLGKAGSESGAQARLQVVYNMVNTMCWYLQVGQALV